MRGRSTVLAIVIGLFVGPIDDSIAAISLESDSDIASAGYFRLQWQAAETPTSRAVSLSDSPRFTRIARRTAPIGESPSVCLLLWLNLSLSGL